MPPLATDVETLSDAHRAEQAARSTLLAAIVARWFLTRVRADDPATIDAWLRAVIPAITRGRGTSAVLAATYGAALRKLELPDVTDGFRFEPMGAVEVEKLRTSLMVVGPQALKKRVEKIDRLVGPDPSPSLVTDPAEVEREMAAMKAAAQSKADMRRMKQIKAQRDTAKAIEGAVVRHVTDGGRQTIAENARLDPKAIQVIDSEQRDRRDPPINYARVLSGDPCYFCAMLASRAAPSMQRGGRYYADSFRYSNELFVGDGLAKVHDHCQCSLKPVYRSDDDYLKRAEDYAEIWHNAGSGSGAAAILAFRQEFEGRAKAS